MTIVSLASEAESRLIGRLRSYYTWARNEKRPYIDGWKRNYLLMHNRMWGESRPNGLPAPARSKIMPIISNVRGWMTDQHIEFNVIPAARVNGYFYNDAAKRANDLETVLHSCYEVLNWGQAVNLCITDGLLYGTGILKTGWDQSMDSGIGNASLTHIPVWDFYPDPRAKDMSSCSFLIEGHLMSLDEIERRWPDRYERLLAHGGASSYDLDESPSLSSNRRAVANPSFLANSNSTSTTGSMWSRPGDGWLSRYGLDTGIPVYECYFKENYEINVSDLPEEERDKRVANANSITDKIVYPRWRCVVHAEGVVLFDEYCDDIYGFNDHPYSRYVYEDLGEFWGLSLASHLAPCQIALNRLLAAAQQNVELTGNPVFLDVANSGIERTQMTNRPGQRLVVSGAAAQQSSRPSWLVPPPMSPQLLQLVEMWDQAMKDISGLSAIARGEIPGGRPSGQTVQSAQEAGYVRIRQGQRNLEFTLRRAGEQIASLIVDNYDTPRMVAITGPTGTPSSLQLAAKHFYSPTAGPDNKVIMTPLKYSILVNAGSDNPTSRQARIAEADTLWATHAIDQEAVLDAHNYPNRQEILQRMAAAQQAQRQFEIDTGLKPTARQAAGRLK